MSLLIGFTGRDTKGADLAATHLRQEHGFEVVRIAAPFEEALAVLLDATPEWVRGQQRSHKPVLPTMEENYSLWEHHPTVGCAIRSLRCEYAQGLHKDFTALQLEQRLQKLSESQTAQIGIVIQDILFNAEADFVRAHGGIVIHLKSDLHDRGSPGHYSGMPITRKDEDLTLPNNGTASDLYLALDNIMARVRGFTGKPEYRAQQSA